ncbi:hypothetical protein [Candidatus Formimonas warabiya]|uniref:hypothetical protein n=1 Tax=Formimonas warabiya TaxID=1761012 RepID=UPI001BE46E5A
MSRIPTIPVSSVAPPLFYRDLVEFAQKYQIIVLHDNTYSAIIFEERLVAAF